MTTRKNCRHHLLGAAQRAEIEEEKVKYIYPDDDPRRAQGLIEWLERDEEAVTGAVFEPDMEPYKSDYADELAEVDVAYSPPTADTLSEGQQAFVDEMLDKMSLIPNWYRMALVRGLG